MKMKSLVPFLLGIAIAVSPMLQAQDRDHHDRGDHHGSDDNANTPLALIGVIGVPGNPIASTDIADVNQATERLYFTKDGTVYLAHAGVKLSALVVVSPSGK